MSPGMRDNNSVAVPASRRGAATLDQTSAAVLRDYVRLAKPRAIVPHLITAAAAMFLTVKGTPPLDTLFLTLIGGGLVAAASNTLNCYFDRELDTRMARTRSRPLPAGRVAPQQALGFGIVIGAVGLLILGQFVGLISAIQAFIALVYYVFAYTLFLKWRAPWNVLIGSGVGGLTPLIGWAAVADGLTATPFLLSAIIVLWTPPHFWSLATFRRSEYEQAGITVLPTRGVAALTIACSVVLVAVSLWLARVAGLGFFYLGTASILGAVLLYLALRLASRMNRGESVSTARRFYFYSIVYIAFLFVAMIVNDMPSF